MIGALSVAKPLIWVCILLVVVLRCDICVELTRVLFALILAADGNIITPLQVILVAEIFIIWAVDHVLLLKPKVAVFGCPDGTIYPALPILIFEALKSLI